MNAGECKGGARAGRFRPERHQRKARVSSGRWEIGFFPLSVMNISLMHVEYAQLTGLEGECCELRKGYKIIV
ncbi:hypothetical protein NDU88_004511 [Pleurodeles waltl]|uniref:Uncharacterized protein n=1 Tax=Pleurodeles waltl TaxID=8319 RepID=A0AAV7NJP1_PLEWA|nr:hypothetical protein NDU88_004511 [Pleurodeles waltl]